MADAPKYDPPAERTEESPCIGVVPDGSSTFRLVIYGKVACSRREDADAALQKLALAIADRVHGAELARLRAVEDSYLDLVKRLRTVIIHTLNDCKAANLALTDRFAIEVFDEASIAVGLPISNDEGVPFELLPPAPAVPTALEMAIEHLEMAELSARALECPRVAVRAEELALLLAAWKATQR